MSVASQVSKILTTRIGINIYSLLGKDGREQIEAVFTPCCGLGRKVVKIVGPTGLPTRIKSFPVTFDANPYSNKEDLEDAIAESYGYGYIVYILKGGSRILVVSNKSKKDEDGLPSVPDELEIT